MAYDKQFMDMAIELAKGCALQDEVPVGCVVVKDGKVVGASGNRKERENNAICHAEILALSEATKAVGNWWLEKCDVYVTLEPCTMCAAAISFARIANLYFGATDEKGGAVVSGVKFYESPTCHHRPAIQGGILERPCSELLKTFFKNKR